MGLETIDPHIHKLQTQGFQQKAIFFGIMMKRMSKSSARNSHLKMSKFTKKCMAIRTLSKHSVRMAKHFFINFDVFKWLYPSQN